MPPPETIDASRVPHGSKKRSANVGSIQRDRPRRLAVRSNRSPRPFLELLEDRLAPASVAGTQPQAAYGQLPISFEANVGQTDASVQFLAHGSGYALFLTPGGAVLSLTQPAAAPTGLAATLTDTVPVETTGVALDLNLVGANPQAQVVGQNLLPGTSNYFIGNDPSQWHTNIANYGEVAYQNVYPGINLVYNGNQQQLEYDFDVAPGADPNNASASTSRAPTA